LIKFLDLIDFKQIFNFGYIPPTRKPKLGDYRMVVGLLMLLFIGFNRLGTSAHEVIGQYDKRADVENLVGEAKRKGLGAVPLAKIQKQLCLFPGGDDSL
jgi:hypothetical protein